MSDEMLLGSAVEHATSSVPAARADETAGSVRDRLPGTSFDFAGDVAVLDGDSLTGLVSVENLLAADAGTPLKALMDPDPPTVSPGADQEVAAWKMVKRGETSLAISWPWVVAFAFGLLHGFGFAGALVGLGLPQGDLPLALLFFNIGVEVGQLVFIAVILAVAAALRRIFPVPRHAPVAAAYAIGTIAAFWGFERLDAMFL